MKFLSIFPCAQYISFVRHTSATAAIEWEKESFFPFSTASYPMQSVAQNENEMFLTILFNNKNR